MKRSAISAQISIIVSREHKLQRDRRRLDKAAALVESQIRELLFWMRTNEARDTDPHELARWEELKDEIRQQVIEIEDEQMRIAAFKKRMRRFFP